ncbi:TonB-dependent receptor domain-containing protein [Paracoccus marinaquae]|uniref:TonB-dependent receptor n=1 Tax=Paracoccus marinaquae TaxID=2841926 RepID=A0ABS6AEG1_9RHOB|nr:TonB-dependent receptor [Paracoccus marinaquae]MBU3028908.1 TonB-dependent receptor [Paracoccus marinaquae]
MNRHFAAITILLGSTALPAAVAAQDPALEVPASEDTLIQNPAAERATALDPIVLSAGVEQVASSVPQSVSVVGGAELNEIQAGNIGDILENVPGVAGVGSGGFFGQGFNIRGFGSPGTAASEAGIVQLIDGEEKYYESYRQGSIFVEPDFLKRVEVLRGPGASTLYGSGALGGIISMETIDAADVIPLGQTSGGRVRLGYASNPDTAFGSIAWGWMPSDDFQALAALAFRKLGDTTDADGDVIVRSNSETPNVLLKATKTFGDQYVEASYQHLEAEGDDQDFNQLDGPQIGLFPGFPGWGVGDILTRDQVARLEWGWAPADNRYIDTMVSLSYTNTIKDTKQGSDPDEPIMDSLLGRRDYALWRLRAQNVSDLSGENFDHFLTIGAETSKQDRSNSTTSSSHPEGYTRSAAIFAWSQSEWGRFSMNAGLRYQRQNTEAKDSVAGVTDEVDGNSFEPQIALMYSLTDAWSVFGSLALVNRLPTVDELYDGFMGGAPSPDLKNEEGRNIEIGVSYASTDLLRAGDEASMKLTLFHNRIDNMIMRTNMPAPTPSYVNIDRAYLRGGELEASYLSGDWLLNAGVSVVDGEDQDGEVLDTLPNNTLLLSAVWQATPDWQLGARGTLAQGRDKPDDSHRGGYGVYDIFAIWTPQQGALDGLEVNMGIDNLTNREYVPATYVTGPAPGRNFKVSLSRAF